MKLIAELVCLSVTLFITAPAWAAAIVTSLTGQASVELSPGGNPIAVSVGTRFSNGNKVQLTPGSSVRALCGNGQNLTLRDAVHIISCASSNDLFTYAGRELPSPRSQTRVLAPVGTLVLDGRPKIRWSVGNPVARVRIVVLGEDVRWERVVPDSGSLIYPDDAPALTGGKAYRTLIFDPEAPTTSPTGALNTGFRVMSPSEVIEVRSLLTKVDAETTGTEFEKLNARAQARLLVGLFADVIDLLEPAVSGNEMNASTLTLIGTAWRLTGCMLCSLPHLEKAFAVAQSANDRRALMEAGALLKDAYVRQGRTSEANAVARTARIE